MSKQKELDADPKAIQAMKFVEQLKNPNNAIVANEFIFFVTVLEKIKETRSTFSHGSVRIL